MNFSLIVFDLDFTLWNAGGTWCDHTYPPYRKVGEHIEDSYKNIIILYPHAAEMLARLSKKYKLGVASRTHQPSWARELMRLFGFSDYFDFVEIYPGSKTEHFYQLQKDSNIPFEEMLFFDDEMRNVEEVGRLGVESVLVDRGITPEIVEKYLGSY